jgi:hypothetical protein
MLLNLKIPAERIKSEVYLAKCIADGNKIDIRKIPEKRTIKQNSYVHKLFTLAGTHFGYTTDEMKVLVKRILGYTYLKDGNEYFTKTSNMDTKELTEFIDRLRNWSSEQGCYLPSADEFGDNNAYYEKEIERAEIIEKRYGY